MLQPLLQIHSSKMHVPTPVPTPVPRTPVLTPVLTPLVQGPQAKCTCGNLAPLARRILQGRSRSPHGSTNPQFHNTHKPRRFGHMGSNNLRPRFAEGAPLVQGPQAKC